MKISAMKFCGKVIDHAHRTTLEPKPKCSHIPRKTNLEHMENMLEWNKIRKPIR